MNQPSNLPPLGVVILAAGASSRMGRPKLLMPWRGATVIGHLLAQWQALDAAQITVVMRADDTALAAELDRLNFPGENRIVNPQPECGMFSSVVCAANWNGWHMDGAVPFRSGAEAAAVQTLRDGQSSPNRSKRLDCGRFSAAFPPPPVASAHNEISHWAIALGDQPHLKTATLRVLLDFSAQHRDAICQPEVDGHARHPVILPRTAFAELQNSGAATLQNFLKLTSVPRVACPVTDSGLSLDMDTPEDYKRLVNSQ